jgi:hypothetical protein
MIPRVRAVSRLHVIAQTTSSGVMSLRFFSAVLLALALFFSPVARMGNGGMAMASQMTPAETPADSHCVGAVDDTRDEAPGADISCASACAAVHAMLPTIPGQVNVRRERESETLRSSLAGVLTEFETPPPRF